MNKIIFLYISFMMLSSCTVYHAVPVSGDTRTTEKGKIIAANMAFIDVDVAMEQTGSPCRNYRENYKVLDTKFDRKVIMPKTKASGWVENWIIEACGKKWRVPVTFYGDVISTWKAYPIK